MKSHPRQPAIRAAASLAGALACLVFLAGCADSLSSRGDGAAAPPAAGSAPSDSELARAAESFTSASTPGSSAYKIGPLDVLDITVFKVPDLSRSVQVADNGTVNLPLVGEVRTSGKTAREVERDLTGLLGARYLNSPQVSVFVKEYNSQRVTLEGAVKKPGVYPLRGKTTLLQFIAIAEGIDRDLAASSVIVFRQSGAGRSAARFDLEDIRAGKSQDPDIQSSDVIVVESSGSKQAFSYFVKALPAASVFRLF